ncbi:MAG: hypothetical protein AB2823_13020 [Candidatus Thiodiazotropha endolucinida]
MTIKRQDKLDTQMAQWPGQSMSNAQQTRPEILEIARLMARVAVDEYIATIINAKGNA